MTSSYEQAERFARVWSRLTAPVRPSAAGLAVYRKELEGVARRRVLVLGATPELVDLALDLGAETIVCLERHPAVLEAMRSVATREWSRVRLVPGDWLDDHPELHRAFDFVLCDGGLLFLAYPTQWERLFARARRYLEPGGAFVAKEWAEPPGASDYDGLVEALLDAYREAAGEPAAFPRLASELRVAAFVGAARSDGSFDQPLLVERCDALRARLEREFPDPDRVETTRAAFVHLARSRPGTTDTIAGVGFADAAPLLERAGFADVACLPLPDPPVPDGNYMLVAR